VLECEKAMQVTLLPPRQPALCAPLTSNRELGDCLIANVPLRELISTELIRGGFEMVRPEQAVARALRIPLDNWIELGALLLLARATKPTCLFDADNNLLAWQGAAESEKCTERIVTDAGCFPIRYPWDLLHINEEVLSIVDESVINGEVSHLASISGAVRIGAGTKILPGTVIEGPVIIGPNCQIGPNAYIRGATSIGANCYVGSGAEVKNSIIYNNSYISRQCYIGDSVIGTHVTLGAGTATENHRNDGRHHTSVIQGRPVNTYRVKLGAMIGDGVKTGVHTSIEAGVKIGIARTTKPGSYVGQDLM
jgi:carbonic anhydrase/acetyltransferase-like protein (isoleucine patch superfamily)